MFLFFTTAPPSTFDLGIIMGAFSNNAFNNFKLQKEFVISALGKLNISPQNVLPGLITYGLSASVQSNIGDISTYSQLVNILNSLNTPLNGNNILAAMRLARTNLFLPAKGSRATVPKVLWVFVDKAAANDANAFRDEAQKLINLGVHLIVVGIGSEISRPDLDVVAGGHGVIIFDPTDVITQIKPVIDITTPGQYKIFSLLCFLPRVYKNAP